MRAWKMVVFPHCEWSRYPYKSLLERLRGLLLQPGAEDSQEPSMFYWMESKVPEQFPAEMRPSTLEELKALPRDEVIAIVSHPYWVTAAASLRPAFTVAWLPSLAIGEQGAELWTRSTAQLTAIADLVCVEEETVFLQYSLRHSAVQLLKGEERLTMEAGDGTVTDTAMPATSQVRSAALPDYEDFVLQAVRSLLEEGSAAPLTPAVWWRRLNYYTRLRTTTKAHETVSFLLAVYLYLLKEQIAEALLLEAFQEVVHLQRGDGLSTHYRFLSAIYAQQDQIAKAVQVYGISVLTEEEQKRYEGLCVWLEQGEPLLAKALLFYYNDDYRSAVTTLREQDTPASRTLLVQLLLEIGRLEEALEQLSRTAFPSTEDRLNMLLLAGMAHVMRGEPHEAIGVLLEATLIHEPSIARIGEVELYEDALRRLMTELTQRQNEREGPVAP
ncbi:tetratricopeptide repeat protein [Paenibacillus koleovorans]|uniref:tetratricopeptide repeat protein n=1 Tax=Paenibacillus koleovorans TaxID=121608 RepID=UPI000FDB3589|nr:hypothetical protein [Paenibacillus koleovorans]